MSKNVDEKVVSMKFDNSNFEKNVQTSMSTLDKLKNSLKFTGAAKGLDEIGSSVKKFDMSPIGNGVETVRAKFSALEVMAVTALANITNSAVNAGKRIVSSLTIDPVKDGFNEYEMTLNAIQTTMAGTGKTAAEVEEELKKLDKYADDTVYSSADMFNNLPKFTNAGVDLEKATTAMIGIANATALAGGDAQKASSAFYNLGQSIGTGYLTRMDYNSINNAGIATMEWKNQMVAAAIAQGKLTKTGEDAYKIGNKTFTLQSLFIDGLQEQWASSDVLMSVFEDYGDTSTEIGKKAQAAAQDIKTFSMLMDSLSATAGTGWKDTWQILVGDLDEAKELWTGVGNVIGKVISDSANARNELLQGWKDLGGRTAIIDSVRNTFIGFGTIIKPIKEAFKEIFPPVTSKQLYNLSKGLENLTSKLKISDETAQKIKSTFKGIFSVFDIVFQAVSALGRGIYEFIGKVSGFGGGILGVSSALGDWVSKLRDSIKETDIFGKVVDKVVGILGKVIDGVKGFGSAIKDSFGNSNISGFTKFMQILARFSKDIASKVVNAFASIGKAIAKVFGENNFMDAVNSMLSAGILVYVAKFVKGLKTSFGDIGNVFENIKGVLDDVRGCFKAYQDQLKAGTLLKIASAIAILAAAIFVISTIDADSLGRSLATIAVMFGELLGALAIFEKMNTKLKSVTKSVTMMIGMSIAILILAGALKKLSSLSWNELAKGLVGVAGLIGLIIAAAKLMETESKAITKFAGQMILLSVAIGVLTIVAKSLAKLDWESLGKSGVGILGFVTILVGAAKFMDSNNKSITKFAGQMLLMSIAVGVLALVAKLLSTMDWEDLIKGGAGILGITTILVGAAKFMDSNSKSITKFGAQMLLMAISLAIITPVLKTLGNMSWEEIGKGLVAIGGALAELAIALNFMNGTLAGSAALLIAAGALALITPVLLVLGNMSWESIIKGLVALGGAFAVIGIAGMLLAPVVPVILGLGAAFALLGIGMVGIGAGLVLIGMGLTAIAAAGAAAATSLVASITIIVTGLLDLIPTLANKISDAIIAIAQVIGESAPALAESFLKLLLNVLVSMAEYIPQMVDPLITLLVGLLDGLTARMPEIINSLVDFVIAVINGLSGRMADLIAAGLNLVASIINGIAKALGPFIELIVGPLIDGLGEALSKVAEGIAPIVESVSQAIQSICDAFISLVEQISPIIDSITALIKQFGDSVSQVFQSFADTVSTCGDTISQVLTSIADTINSVFSGIAEVITSIGDSIRTVLDGIAGIITSIGEAALNAGTGFENLANGVKTITSLDLVDMALSLAAVAKGIKSIAKHSEGLAETGNGMKNIASGATISAIAFTTLSTQVSNAVSKLASIGPAVGNAASALSSSVATLSVSFVNGFNTMVQVALSAITCRIASFYSAGMALSANLQNGIRTGLSPIAPLMLSVIITSVAYMSSASQTILYTCGLLLMAKLAQGITVGGSKVNVSLSSALAKCVDGIKMKYGSFYDAGSYLVEGFANGVELNTYVATRAAEAMAEAALEAVKAVFDMESPSKESAKIGKYVVMGLANGIDDNVGIASRASAQLGTSVLQSIQKRLGINSPSIVFNKEVGRYIVQGIAEGITSDMSAEDAASKKADNIVSAFKKELDKLSLDDTTLNLENELWDNTTGLTASESQAIAKDIETTDKQLAIQEKRVQLASDEYQETIIQFGETSEKTQEAYNKLLTEKIEMSKLSTKLSELQSKEFEANQIAVEKYIAWMEKNAENLKSVGFTADEIDAAAKSISGYNVGSITTEIPKTEKELLSNLEKTRDATENESEKIGGSITDGLGKGISSGLSNVVKAVGTVVGNVLTAAKDVLGIHSPSKEFFKIGDYSIQGFVNALISSNSLVYDEGYMTGQSAIDGMSNAIAKVKSLSADSVDYKPTITPVVDMSRSNIGGLKIGAGIDATLTKPIDSMSRMMYDAQTRIDASNKEVISSIDGLREDLKAYAAAEPPETALYVDSKKLAASIAKPMDRQLNIPSKRRAY